jgi:Pentapeptide repeats (8 copies)
VLYGVGWFVVSLSLFILATASDEIALKAVTNPGWYCWLLLCALSMLGLALTFFASGRGMSVPLYFRILLMAGATCGAFTFSAAWQVITANKAHAEPVQQGADLDLRDKFVHDTSYAGRNLRGSDLSGATLDRVDLSDTDLAESDLRRTSFRKVDLSGADLCGVDLRGADLRGALGLRTVKDWSYVFYNEGTKLPASDWNILSTHAGPIPDSGHDLLYMCQANVVRRLHG